MPRTRAQLIHDLNEYAECFSAVREELLHLTVRKKLKVKKLQKEKAIVGRENFTAIQAHNLRVRKTDAKNYRNMFNRFRDLEKCVYKLLKPHVKTTHLRSAVVIFDENFDDMEDMGVLKRLIVQIGRMARKYDASYKLGHN